MRTIDGTSTLFTFDEWKPLIEWNTGGVMTAWNMYGPGADEILWRGVGGRNLRYHSDKQGNVTGVLNDAGYLIESYTYDAYGAPKVVSLTANGWDYSHPTSSAYGNNFMFQGREYLSTFGVYDYRHRFYQPELGRFIQQDPTGFDAGDMNLFRYCADDPVDKTDPTGLQAFDIFFSGPLAILQNAAALEQQRQQQQQPAGNEAAAASQSQNELVVRSANVVITGESRLEDQPKTVNGGGRTPDPRSNAKTIVSTRRVDGRNLALTYHLHLINYYNLRAGTKTLNFALKHEWDHPEDFFAAQRRFQAAAATVVGHAFGTRVDAARALDAAVNPVVRDVYRESKQVWDKGFNAHYPLENGRPLDFSE